FFVWLNFFPVLYIYNKNDECKAINVET
uniref:Uncharacterized protein n=1 Tax=Panagrolaimus sp. PS1159 TaxID=55785 RepID=A0AC35G643_9BILA